MKFVKGWYLPDSDTHFENYIKALSWLNMSSIGPREDWGW